VFDNIIFSRNFLNFIIDKIVFSSIISIFDSLSNLFESNCCIKTSEKLIRWRIIFKILNLSSIKQLNWILIFSKKFSCVDLSSKLLRTYYTCIFANKRFSLNNNWELSIEIDVEETLWTRRNRQLTRLLYCIDIDLHYKRKQVVQTKETNLLFCLIERSKSNNASSSFHTIYVKLITIQKMLLLFTIIFDFLFK